MSMGAAKRR